MRVRHASHAAVRGQHLYTVHLPSPSSCGRQALSATPLGRDKCTRIGIAGRVIRKAWTESTPGGVVSEEASIRQLSKAVSLIKRADSLVPYDPQNFNIALAIWKAIREVSEEDRKILLDKLDSRDIKSLWDLSAQRFSADQVDIQNTLGPEYSLWNEFPEDIDKVDVWEGKAAVPALGRFRKLFFLHPKSYELYGHVDVGWKPFGRLLYPLYFKCNVEQVIFPGTSELSDMQLAYSHLDRLALLEEDLPKQSRLPRPAKPRWPFNSHLTDYCRAVGPGVLVGRGWKDPKETFSSKQGFGFLYFVLVKTQ